jgi:hypothetical protein
MLEDFDPSTDVFDPETVARFPAEECWEGQRVVWEIDYDNLLTSYRAALIIIDSITSHIRKM